MILNGNIKENFGRFVKSLRACWNKLPPEGEAELPPNKLVLGDAPPPKIDPEEGEPKLAALMEEKSRITIIQLHIIKHILT